jgi:S-adenosylmethionine:tRNA ribosyltransferase-isomerase
VRLAASRPPEARALARDGVRLLVATPDGLAHARFADLPHFLAPGDLLVVNTSATVAAALTGQRGDGQPVTVHLSSQLEDGSWLVELREPDATLGRVTDAVPGQTVTLPGGTSLTLLHPFPDPAATRMWAAAADGDVLAEAARHGRPIRYPYVPDPWPLAAYQSVFARSPGSAEMPSAARPFTPELVTSLVTAGVLIAPITLHAGVASLETGEEPLPEWCSVPEPTAQLVNLTLATGRRVIAVGTTCTRALESAADPAITGQAHPAGPAGRADRTSPAGPADRTGQTGPADRTGQVGPAALGPASTGPVKAFTGWTGLVLGTGRPARVVSGLITGWHDAGASHLALLEAVAGTALVAAAYQAAEQAGYLWHEFGDSCLLLPPVSGPWYRRSGWSAASA